MDLVIEMAEEPNENHKHNLGLVTYPMTIRVMNGTEIVKEWKADPSLGGRVTIEQFIS
jgi:hypothetical protein